MGGLNKKWSQAQRILVVDLFKQYKTFRLIQEATGMALGIISNLVKKYKKFGHVKSYPRSVVKSKITSRIDRQIVKMISQNQFLSRVKTPICLCKHAVIILKKGFLD